MIPPSCKDCQHNCKDVARGSKKCRIRLGLIKKEKGVDRETFNKCILWYYYNTAKGLYDKKKK